MGAELDYNAQDFRSVILYMRGRFGVGIFAEAARMYAIFRDLSPKLAPYGNIMRQLSERGLLADLQRASEGGPRTEQGRVMLKARDFLETELLLGPDRAIYFLSVLGELYGLDAPQRSTSPTQSGLAAPQPSAISAQSGRIQSARTSVQAPTQAAPPTNGVSGALSWSLTSGVLTVSGVGDMDDFAESGYHRSSAPWSAFRDKIQAVVLERGVAGIGRQAFYYCANLQSVKIPRSVTRIGYMAFRGCASLQRVTLPDSVQIIETSAFEDCAALRSVAIPKGVTSIEGHAFAGCSNLASVTIPNGVKSIGYRAFRDCAKLTRVVVPANASIDADAFAFATEIIRR